LEELKKNISLSVDLNKEHEEITFKEFSDMYIEHERLYKEYNTITGYEVAIIAFEGLHELEIAKIKNIDIQRCVDALIKSRKANSTTKLYLSRIYSIFNSAVNMSKIMLENPVKNVIVPKYKPTNEKRALTKLELKTLLGSLKNRKYYVISLIASKCGLRLGEILGLRWLDIDEKSCSIIVNKQWKRLSTGKYGIGSVKSKNSNRIVPISIKVLAELIKYKNEIPSYMDKRIFKNKSSESISNALKNIYKKAGFDISIHELRHTCATNLISNGMDFKMAAEILGHDVQETYKTYAHVNSDIRQRAAELINLID